jgi:threonine/homoserine/homoserine lactone efflux protein
VPAPGQLLPFLLAVALIELTPGPNMGYLALVASRFGRTAGMITVAGVTTALALYLLASLAGLSQAAARWPWIFQGLRWAGVFYLIWLAFDTWRAATASVSAELRAPHLFLRGFLANVLNPKVAVFYIVLLPSFIAPDVDTFFTSGLALGAIHLAVSVIVHATIVVVAASARPALDAWNDEGGGRFLQRAFAIGLLLVALWLMITTGDAALR